MVRPAYDSDFDDARLGDRPDAAGNAGRPSCSLLCLLGHCLLAALLVILLSLATGVIAVAAFGQPAPATRQAATRPAVGFTIAAWQVPVEDVAKWQARGVTTFVGHVDYGGRMTQEEWERRVAAQGGRYITYVGDHPQEQAREPNRAGFVQRDEPDTSNHVDKPGYTPAEFRLAYERARGTGLPVYLTCGAMDNAWYDGRPKPLTKNLGEKYGHRADAGGWLAYCDVAGCDWYVYTWGRNEAIGFPVVERLLDRLHEWGGGKPIYFFVETCTQGKPYAMAADQWERQVLHVATYCRAKGYALAGVCYFSHVMFPRWSAFDGTSPEVAARMPAVNARLRQMFAAPPPPPVDPEKERLRAERDALAATVARVREALATQPTTQPAAGGN